MAAPVLITHYTENRDDRLTLPPSVVADDLLLVLFSKDANSDPLPSGWFRVNRVYTSGDGQTLACIGRIADGSESSTLLFPGGGDATWLVYQYRGVDTTTPIGATSSNKNDSASGAVIPDVSLVLPAVTTTVADSIVFCAFGGDVTDDSATYTYTTPSGFGNKLSNQEAYETLCAFDKVQATAGSSGTITCAMNTDGIEGIAFVINAVSSGGGDQTLLPDLLTQTKTIYAPTVTPGEITVNPGLLTQTKTIFAPVIAVGAITLLAPLLTNTPIIYSPTVSTGEINISAPLLTQSKTIFSPTVSAGAITLAAPLLSQTKTIYAPTVAVASGDQTLSPPLLTQTKTIYTPTVAVPTGITLSLPLLTRTAVIYTPTASVGVSGLMGVSLQNHILTGAEQRNSFVSVFVRQPITVGSGDATHLLLSDIGWVRGTSNTSSMANPFTVTQLYLENGTSSVQVTKNGQTSWVVNPDDDDSQGDLIAASSVGLSTFTRGTTYWIKFEITLSTAGHTVPFANGRSTTSITGSQAWWVNKANTTVSAVSAPGVFTSTGTPPDSRQNSYCPMVLGLFVNPSAADTWFFIGDSVFQGQGDVTNYPGGYGIAQRSLYNVGVNILAGINFTRIGAATSAALTSPNDRHLRWARYCKYRVDALGTNDFGTTGNSTTALTYLSVSRTLWAKLRSYFSTKIIRTKLGPRTSSTDAWATEALQTPTGSGWASGGEVQAYNAALDSEVGVNVDAVAQMNFWRGVDPIKWNSNGTPNYPTTDGTHPASVNHIALGAELRVEMDAIAAGSSITLLLPLLTQTKTIYAPTVSADALTITLPLLIQTKTIFEPTLVNDITISLPLLNHGSTVFAPSVSQVIDVPLITQSKVIYPPVLSQGAVIIVPPVLIQTKVIFEPEVTFGAITISAPLITQTKSIFVPTVDVGGLNLLLPLIERTKVVFEPSISAGSITIEPGLLIVDKTVFSPSVSVDQTIDIPLLTRDKVIYPFTLTQYEAGLIVIELPLLTRTKVIYTPGLAAGVLPVVTVVSGGAVTTEILGHTIADNISVKTTVSSLGTIVQGNELLNTSVAGMLTVMPDNLL